MTVQELSLTIKQDNDRWWKDLETGELKERNFGELIALAHSELSEALEAHRKNKMDDKLPHRHGVVVELADCVIRILDTTEHLYPDFWEALLEKLEYNRNRKDHTNEERLKANGKKY